jgi:uncharacterized protein DUF3455
MNYKPAIQTRKSGRVRNLFVTAFIVACAFATVTCAMAQNIQAPSTPEEITPPPGNTAFIVGHAKGTQGYVCLPKDGGASWTVANARPEATLFDSFFGQDIGIITHFLSPDLNPNEAAPNPLPFGSATWQSSFDNSMVWAQPAGSIVPGSDASCPNADSIKCLLLQSIGSLTGPAGGSGMTKVSFIQRLNTTGGAAPAEDCSVSDDVGNQKLVPYTADYYFFRGPQ